MLELIEAAKNDSKIIPGTNLLEYANELKDQGFNLLANQIFAKHYGYLKITQAQITDFLSRRWYRVFKNGEPDFVEEIIAYWKSEIKRNPEYHKNWNIEQMTKDNFASGRFPYGLQNDFHHTPLPTDFISMSVSRTGTATEEEIQAHSINWSMRGYSITKTLNWHERPIATYSKIPPDGIIEKFKICRQRNIFDEYVIADLSVTTLIEIKDPLLLGRLNGSKDRYLIGQWDDDILVDDLI